MARKLKQKGGKGPAPTRDKFQDDPVGTENSMTAEQKYNAAYTAWEADESMEVVEDESVPTGDMGEGEGETVPTGDMDGEGATSSGGKRHKKKGGKKSKCSWGGKKSAKKMGGKRGSKKTAKKMGGKRRTKKV